MIILGEGIRIYEFMTPGSFTWTCPDGVDYALVFGRGGSGGGGGGSGILSGAGGQGCYTQSLWITNLIYGQDYDVVVGAGGVGGDNTSVRGYKGSGVVSVNVADDGEDTRIFLGSNTLFRARGGLGGYVTFNPGGLNEGAPTIGSSTNRFSNQVQSAPTFGGCGRDNASATLYQVGGPSPFAKAGTTSILVSHGGGGGGGDGPGGDGGTVGSPNGKNGVNGGGGGGAYVGTGNVGGNGSNGYLQIITFRGN